MLKAVYNFLVVFSFMVMVLFFGIFTDLFVWNETKRLKLRVEFLHRITKIGTKLIGIKIKHTKNADLKGAHFIVSNHLSYLDIVVLSSLYKTVFVSTTEVESIRFFGRLAKYGGSIFIDRKNRLNIKQDLNHVKQVLENGINIVIFLEGTTSNGDGILSFKSSFLEVVFQTDKPVVGICIKYRFFNQKEIKADNRDYVYYYADHTLLPHLVKFLSSLKSLEVDVREAGIFLTKDYPSRKHMANNLHHKISTLYAS